MHVHCRIHTTRGTIIYIFDKLIKSRYLFVRSCTMRCHYEILCIVHNMQWNSGEDTPILEGGREPQWYWTLFLKCLNPFGSFFMLNSILLAPSFCNENGWSLSHLVPDIIWPKFNLTFHQNLSFNSFTYIICSVWQFWNIEYIYFFPWFSIQFLDLLDPSFFTKASIQLGHFIITCWTPPTKHLANYPRWVE